MIILSMQKYYFVINKMVVNLFKLLWMVIIDTISDKYLQLLY